MFRDRYRNWAPIAALTLIVILFAVVSSRANYNPFTGLAMGFVVFVWGPLLAGIASFCAWIVRLARRRRGKGAGPSIGRAFACTYLVVVILLAVLICLTEYITGGTRP